MLLGVFPYASLLTKYNLNEFLGISEAVKAGNLQQMDSELNKYESFFLSCGVYLILEKLKLITYRNLFKKVFSILCSIIMIVDFYWIGNFNSPNSFASIKTFQPLVINLSVSILFVLIETTCVLPMFAVPYHIGEKKSDCYESLNSILSHCELVYAQLNDAISRFSVYQLRWCAIMKTHLLPIDVFTAALRLMGVDDIDQDETECILANLIYEGKIKGYLAHQQQKLVVSKLQAFPTLTAPANVTSR